MVIGCEYCVRTSRMVLNRNKEIHCHQCGNHLEQSVEMCPHCSFHPRNEGLRYAGILMMLVAILMSIVVLGGGTWPYLAAYGMLGVFLLFGLAVVAFVVAFVATPHRLGWIFT